MISVVLPTLRREPRFQEIADSLANNLAVLRGTGASGDLELVVVDGRLWYDDEKTRRAQVADAVAGRFILRHVPPKPTVWQGPHRLTKTDKWDKASASNTGLCYATRSCVVFIDDCCVLSHDFLLWHLRMHQLGHAACGGYLYTKPGARVEGGRLVGAEFQSPGDHRLCERSVPSKCPGGWMYGGNASCALDVALRADGFDEIMSGQGGLEDCEFGLRLSRLSPVFFLPSALAYQLTETHETVGEFLSNMHLPNPDRPCSCGHPVAQHPQYGGCRACGCQAFKSANDAQCKGFRYLAPDGVEHFMSDNHRPIYRLQGYRLQKQADGRYTQCFSEDLRPELARFTAMGNRYRLADLRALAQAGRPLPVPDKPTHDWRDGQPLVEM